MGVYVNNLYYFKKESISTTKENPTRARTIRSDKTQGGSRFGPGQRSSVDVTNSRDPGHKSVTETEDYFVDTGGQGLRLQGSGKRRESDGYSGLRGIHMS